jgi:hypothetical protein
VRGGDPQTAHLEGLRRVPAPSPRSLANSSLQVSPVIPALKYSTEVRVQRVSYWIVLPSPPIYGVWWLVCHTGIVRRPRKAQTTGVVTEEDRSGDLLMRESHPPDE